ncbi:MAG: cellulose-binding domain-containing protein [Clostridia bacterium]|nr:cellulose-binding domain-containing protein [Clostridia bacterium]
MRNLKKMMTLFIVSLFTLSLMFSTFANATTSTTTYDAACYKTINGLYELTDGAEIMLKNLNTNGVSWASWYMGGRNGFIPMVQTTKDPLNFRQSASFKVKKFSENTYGLYIKSPYDNFDYYLCVMNDSTINLKRTDSADILTYKWNISLSNGKSNIKPVGDNAPVIRMLCASPDSSVLGLGSTEAGISAANVWSIKKAMPCTIEYKESSYEKGYSGNITITNKGNYTIKDWSLYFFYQNDISSASFVGAKLQSYHNGEYVVKNDGTNAMIYPWDKVTFNFYSELTNITDKPNFFKVIDNSDF